MSEDVLLERVALPYKASVAFGYVLLVPTSFLFCEDIFLLIINHSSILDR